MMVGSSTALTSTYIWGSSLPLKHTHTQMECLLQRSLTQKPPEGMSSWGRVLGLQTQKVSGEQGPGGSGCFL